MYKRAHMGGLLGEEKEGAGRGAETGPRGQEWQKRKTGGGQGPPFIREHGERARQVLSVAAAEDYPVRALSAGQYRYPNTNTDPWTLHKAGCDNEHL